VLADGTTDKDGRDHRRGRQAMMNAVKRLDVEPLRVGGEGACYVLQLRRWNFSHKNVNFVHCHHNSKKNGR
jgi:hypothetical protein